MVLLVLSLLTAALFLGVEWLFRFRRRGRIVLGALVLIWALADAILSASENPDARSIAFAASFLSSSLPLILWLWVSSWIRGSRVCLRGDKVQSPDLTSESITPKMVAVPSAENLPSSASIGRTELLAPGGHGGTLFDPTLLLRYETVRNDATLIVCVEAAKRLFPQYLEDPARADRSVTAAATAIIDSVLFNVLAEPPLPGREMVLICVGSPGSGKTTTLTPSSDRTIGLKIEEVFDDLERAQKLIKDIIDSGRKPVILWLYVDDFGKTVERMFRRSLKIGRADQLDRMVLSYKAVPEVLEKLKQEFADSLKIHVVNNSGEKGEQRFIQDSNRIWSPAEDAIATVVGMAQVDAANLMLRENPDFEVEY